MDALRRKIPLAHYLFPISKSTISAEEALNTNPDEMYRNLTFAQKMQGQGRNGKDEDDNIEDFIRHADTETIETVEDDLTLRSSLMEPSYAGCHSSVAGSHSSWAFEPNSIVEGSIGSETKTLTNSIGTIEYHKQPVRHGYTENNLPYKTGDLLPTGHHVKLPYPKSIAAKLADGMARQEDVHGKKKKKNRNKHMNRLLPPIS